ncbi:MAG TPA: zf-HC2 domain-containing protein [Planctomycetota bacterium]|nr:zf-HC2 domain-containing protein [Planctomycetota bacterium]
MKSDSASATPGTMTEICESVQNSFRRYTDNALSPLEAAAVMQHLETCQLCKEKFSSHQQVVELLAQAYQGRQISEEFDQGADKKLMEMQRPKPAPRAGEAAENAGAFLDAEAGEPVEAGAWRERLSAAPWWGVSLVLHGLVIALAGLISMAFELPNGDQPVITVTTLAARPMLTAQEEKRELNKENALASKKETPPVDPTSKEMCDVVVPPNLQAEIGDHFETINPDRPDMSSAFGNEEAKMFHNIKGDDSPAGGGGNDGFVLDDAIGVGGASSAGTGGGWGGGNGTGIGVGNGSGRGSFGNRNGGGRRAMIKRHGGSPATENAVEKALAWLARHQEREGHWAAEKYADNVVGARHGGGGVATVQSNTVGVSGLALLAFLGAGHSLKVGKYRENVVKGVDWLVKNQKPDGHLAGGGCSISTAYCHHIATLALCEAYAMGRPAKVSSYEDELKKGDPNDALRKAIEKALELIYAWQDQNPQGAWSYPANAQLDPTVTGWAVMALKAAKIAGFNVPADRVAKAMEGVKTICSVDTTKGDYGHALTGYRARGGIAFGSKGYACTAAGMVIHMFLGVMDDGFVQAAAGTITQDDALPAWIFKPQDPATDHQNLYYWYYGTLGCFQVGGDPWKKWNQKLKDALLPTQCKGGPLDGTPQDRDGSWDPDDVWGAWGGRVYSTALGCLSLEVYYRYVRLGKE